MKPPIEFPSKGTETPMPEPLRSVQVVTQETLAGQLLGHPDHPAISVELYGSLRIRSGQTSVTVRADTIRAAMKLLLAAKPELTRLLPELERLPESHRFSVNGLTVTTNLDTPLTDGDRVVLFSASVGG